MNTVERLAVLSELYSLLSPIAPFRLGHLSKQSLPTHGVYFFFDDLEQRSDSGTGPRIVRIGTHALTATSKSTLRQRLSSHRGSVKSASGNHRGSIFRLLVGEAILNSGGWGEPVLSWGHGSTAAHEVRVTERDLERRVSEVLHRLNVRVLAVPDRAMRAYIETNAIALISNYRKPQNLDAPSPAWLGFHSPREKVRLSGLWNQHDVERSAEPAFISCLATLAGRNAPHY